MDKLIINYQIIIINKLYLVFDLIIPKKYDLNSIEFFLEF